VKVASLALTAALGLTIAVATVGATDEPGQTVTVTRTETVRQLQMFQRKPAVWWAKRTWYWKRRTLALKRTLLHRPEIVEAINLSCLLYGNCATLWRKARCESVNFTDFYNEGSHASGMFQFLPSTWAGTPFGRFSVFSWYANALAAGWMHQQGRGREWVCR
jgi:hypothetical protein